MEKMYAKILYEMTVHNSVPFSYAVEALEVSLKKSGRQQLMNRAIQSFKRLLESERAALPRLWVAQAHDATLARKQAHKYLGDRSDVLISHDATLIGGWRFEGSETVIDNSYKQALLGMFRSAVSS